MPFFITRRFLPLFITQFLGAFNDNILKNALVILITYKAVTYASINAQILVTLAAGIFILPFFLFSAVAGQIADKWDKSAIIRIIKLSEIGIMMLAGFGFYEQSTLLLLLALCCMGLHSSFFGPVKYAILPEHLKKEELLEGNGFIEAGTFIAILLGTLLGGLLVLAHPAGEMLVALIMLMIAIGGFLASIFIPPSVPSCPQLVLDFNIVRQTKQIVHFAASHRIVFLCILGISWFWLVGATFLGQFPSYAKNILGANEHVVTLFLTLFSLGIGGGSLLCNRLLKGAISAYYVPIAAIGLTICGIDLYIATSIMPESVKGADLLTLREFLSHVTAWRIIGDLLLFSICGGLYVVPLYSLLQYHSPEEYRSRIIAANNIMNALFMVISAVFTSLLLALHIQVSTVFLLISLANLAVSFYICGLLPETVIKSSLRWLLIFLYRVEVKGLKHYHDAGDPLLIVANHTSFLDALLLAVFLPDKSLFAINSKVATSWWLQPFLPLVDIFPMDPRNPMATKSLIERLRAGGKAVIFPEGRITVTGSLMKIYEGPGMIADKAKARILPVRIEGAQYSIFSRLRGRVRLSWFPKITLTILSSHQFTIPQELKGRLRRKAIGDKLYDVMSDMLFESSNYHVTLFQSLIDSMAIHGGNHPIVMDIEKKAVTYRQLIMRSFILSRLIAPWVTHTMHVGVLLPSMASTIMTFFALQARGKVPVMLNFSAPIPTVLVACETLKLSVVLTSRRFIDNAKLHGLAEALAQKLQLVYLEDIRQDLHFMTKLYGLVAALFPSYAYKKYVPHPDPKSAAVVLFTSGSEGVPKGVVLSHENIQANRYQIMARVDFSPRDLVFNALPLFHSFGLTAGTLLPVLSGVKTFFYPSPLHYRIIPELVYDMNATILFGTDTFLSGYARFAHPYDFYCLRYIFAGAEKLKETTRAVWTEKYGVRVFEGYGVTETAPVLGVNTPMHHKPGTVGRLLPSIDYFLQPIPGIAEGGRLFVKGPNVMAGYIFYNNPGVLVPPVSEQGAGWYDTGDIVSIDAEGFITIQGRAKRFAKIGGEMISLAAVEDVITDFSPDKKHAVLVTAHETKGEQLVLFTEDETINREKMQQEAKARHLSPLAVPQKIVYVDHLPLLGSGKVDFEKVKEMLP